MDKIKYLLLKTLKEGNADMDVIEIVKVKIKDAADKDRVAEQLVSLEARQLVRRTLDGIYQITPAGLDALAEYRRLHRAEIISGIAVIISFAAFVVSVVALRH